MNNKYIIDFELTTPIVIEDVDKENLKPIAEKLGIDYSVIDDVLHSRKAVRFFQSKDSERNTVSYCARPRQVMNFNSFEVVGTSEVDKGTQGKQSRVLHGSHAVKCLAILAHVDLPMVADIQIPLAVYSRCNHRQWADISELVAKVLTRSNRLFSLMEMGAPSIILINEERILQENVQYLECNSSLVRNDGTLMRSLYDMEYSLVRGDLSVDTESDDLDFPFEFDKESGDEE